MDRSRGIDNKWVAAVRLAETAYLAAFDDDERRAAEQALIASGVALADERDRFYCEATRTGIIADATTWLQDHEDHPDWDNRFERWLVVLEKYCAMCDALTDALVVLGRPDFEEPIEGATRQKEMAL